MKMPDINLYVNVPGHYPDYETIGEALESLGHGVNTAENVFPAPEHSGPRIIVHIGKGVYREKLTVKCPGLTFLGEGETRDDVVLAYGDYAMDTMPEGDRRGTFRTASVRIDTHDFTAKRLTFQNDAGQGKAVGQALALYVDGDRNYFEDCAFLGYQDTLFTAPLPLKEMEPGGFRGPGEFKPRIMGRQCYRNCHISGNVDFIFGSAIAYFENCVIFSRLRKNSSGICEAGKPFVHGYVAAASTPEGEPFGYVFRNCRLESDCPPDSVYLGRPWREYAKTVFLNCELGAHIRAEGWHDWDKPHGHFYFAEYHSRGAGANPGARADFSHQLTDDEAAEYTVENVLMGWEPG